MRNALLVCAMSICAMVPVRAQWTMLQSNTTADLRGIHNVGGGVAWASGTNGTVLRSVDDGATWTTCLIPPDAEKLDFRGVQAFDADTAIVMSSGKGDLSRLYKTTDGCKSWKLVFTNPDSPSGFFDCLWLHHTGYGILLGDPVKRGFVVLETTDGGNTWKRDKGRGLSIGNEQIAAFAASNSLFSQFANGYMRGFVTGGKGGAFLFEKWTKGKWIRKPIPIASNNESSGVFSLGYRFSKIACSECERPFDHTFVAVGGDFLKPDESAGTSAWSNDLGETWRASTTPPHGYRSAVAFDESTKIWITVGPNGTDISTDDGRKWRAVLPNESLHEAPDADRNWNALSLPFVVGPHGRIGKLDPNSLRSDTPAQ